MKNNLLIRFFASMLSEGGNISSNRSLGTLCVIFLILCFAVDVALKVIIKSWTGVPPLIYENLMGLITIFFGGKLWEKNKQASIDGKIAASSQIGAGLDVVPKEEVNIIK